MEELEAAGGESVGESNGDGEGEGEGGRKRELSEKKEMERRMKRTYRSDRSQRLVVNKSTSISHLASLRCEEIGAGSTSPSSSFSSFSTTTYLHFFLDLEISSLSVNVDSCWWRKTRRHCVLDRIDIASRIVLVRVGRIVVA